MKNNICRPDHSLKKRKYDLPKPTTWLLKEINQCAYVRQEHEKPKCTIIFNIFYNIHFFTRHTTISCLELYTSIILFRKINVSYASVNYRQVDINQITLVLYNITMNKTWHESNKMPVNPTKKQQVAWHIEHLINCNCRKPTPNIQKLIDEYTATNWEF